MADLSVQVAQGLVGYLLTIGHPYQQAAVNATALNLIKWCKGDISRRMTPEQQAQALVEDAAETWEKWPEGGTRALLELFRAKYAPQKKVLTAEESVASMIGRGQLAPPCDRCDPGLLYCQYGGSRAHAHYDAEAAARAKVVIDITTSPKPKPTINLDQLLARAPAVYEEEQYRKCEQLQRVGMA